MAISGVPRRSLGLKQTLPQELNEIKRQNKRFYFQMISRLLDIYFGHDNVLLHEIIRLYVS